MDPLRLSYGNAPSSNGSNGSDMRLTASERRKEQLQTQQAYLNQQQTAIKDLMGKCTGLGAGLLQLEATSLFERKVDLQGEQPHTVRVSAAAGCPPGTYKLEVERIATVSSLLGLSQVFRSLGNDPDTIVLKAIPALQDLKAGFCIINRKKININPNDSLGSVMEMIQNLTGIQVTYQDADSTLTFSHNAPLPLGTPGDSSDFLKLLGIWGKGGQNTVSTAPLLKLDFTQPLEQLPLAISLSPTGKFCINGLEFSYEAVSDTFLKISEAIQNSPAQALLSYEQASKAFRIENKTKGALDIYIEDLEGNFLQAFGLAQGTFSLGKSSQVKINQQTYLGASDSLESKDHGIQDLCIQMHGEGTVSCTVSVDTQGPKDKIENALIKPYNELKNFIQTKAAFIQQGEKRTPGLLSDSDFSRFNDTLRRYISGLEGQLETTGALTYLHQIGIGFTEQTLSLKNPVLFEDQLKTKPQDVQKLLKAIACMLRKYLEQQTKASQGDLGGGLLWTKNEAVSRAIQKLKAEIEKTNSLIEKDSAKQKADAFTVSINQRRMRQGASYFPATSLV